MSASSSRARFASRGKRKWQETSTREELKRTIGWDEPRTVVELSHFSGHHPMIPKRYVPPWQTDMENRKIIIQTCKLAKNPAWTGHISYFVEGRERLNSTSYQLYGEVLNYSRNLHKNKSHLSRFNSSVRMMS